MKTGEELKKWHLEFQETSSNESLNQCNSNEFLIENASDLVSESDEVDEEILDQTSESTEMNTLDIDEDDLNNEQNENSNNVEETETKKINWFRKSFRKSIRKFKKKRSDKKEGEENNETIPEKEKCSRCDQDQLDTLFMLVSKRVEESKEGSDDKKTSKKKEEFALRFLISLASIVGYSLRLFGETLVFFARSIRSSNGNNLFVPPPGGH